MSKSLISENNPVHMKAAMLKNLSSGGKSRGGEFVNARTRRRAAEAERRRALKKTINKITLFGKDV